ncbi:MAG: hypothetical protein ACRYGF_14050, partial [Janthinobacterium lividum]
GRPVLLVLNKVDLQTTGTAEQDTINDIGRDKRSWPVVCTSAVTGEGIPQLRQALLHLVSGGTQSAGNATLTNLRQRAAVDQAYTALLRAEAAAGTSTPHEMILLDLYEALHALDELTGETTPDDVLNLIFSTFCIGK